MKLVVLALLVCACGPNRGNGQPCDESIQARAAGAYDGADLAAGERAFVAYRHSCRSSCRADNDACFEYTLLNAGRSGELVISEIPKMQRFCELGRPLACAWLETNREAIAEWNDPSDPPDPVEAPETAIMRAARALTGTAMANDQSLLQGATYSMVGTSDISFDVDGLVNGRSYVIALVAERAMTFTAKLHTWAMTGDLLETYVSDDVFVRAAEFRWDDDVNSTITIKIHADGSERGDVRFLLFGTD